MATKKTKVNFSKFFPEDNFYVALSGWFDPNATNKYDFLDLDLTIQNGTKNSISFYTWMDDGGATVKQLKAIQEGAARAIKIIEEAQLAMEKLKKEDKKKEPIKVEPRVTKQRK